MKNLRVTKKMAAGAAAAGSLLAALLFFSASEEISLGQAYQRVTLDGQTVGHVLAEVNVKDVFCAARRELALETDEKLCMDYVWNADTVKKPFVDLMREEELKNALKESLKKKTVSSGERVFTVAIDGYRGNFRSLEEVSAFLNGVKDRAEGAGLYAAAIEPEDSHISGILRARLEECPEEAEEKGDAAAASAGSGARAGSVRAAEAYLWGSDVRAGSVRAAEDSLRGSGARAGSVCVAESSLQDAVPGEGDGAGSEDAYQSGVLDMEFVERVEVYQNYVSADEISQVREEIEEVTKEKESNKIYVVESGDCLSVIAIDNNTTVASIMALNGMESADEIIRAGQELVIAVPEPDLKLRVTMGEIYEEDYTEEPVIINNDSWYTNQEVVLEEGTTGHRERNDVAVYENGVEISRVMVRQNVMVESQPTVIERGTVIPPTYVKPISGGRFTSGFGYRWGRMHKGVDWACPVGTTVYASCEGTVIQASYNGGYGNNVVISHPDGRMTRYAHNSRLLVTAGQTVEQGDPIAKSGNTGRSTGPHVHFELYINGTAVNPLQYIGS